jgi:hypothetical protein
MPTRRASKARQPLLALRAMMEERSSHQPHALFAPRIASRSACGNALGLMDLGTTPMTPSHFLQSLEPSCSTAASYSAAPPPSPSSNRAGS